MDVADSTKRPTRSEEQSRTCDSDIDSDVNTDVEVGYDATTLTQRLAQAPSTGRFPTRTPSLNSFVEAASSSSPSLSPAFLERVSVGQRGLTSTIRLRKMASAARGVAHSTSEIGGGVEA